MLRDALNLRNAVTVERETLTADGYGGNTISTASTTIERAALWSAGAAKSLISDQLMAISTHVLVCEADEDIVFTDKITYGGDTYTITGHPDNVMAKDEILVVPLKRVN